MRLTLTKGSSLFSIIEPTENHEVIGARTIGIHDSSVHPVVLLEGGGVVE